MLNYAKEIIDKFKEGLVSSLKSQNMPDYATVSERFEQIKKIVGAEKVEHLESAIEAAFLACPISLIIMQSMITHMTTGLCMRDPQTSKQIFQLILDEQN